MRVPILALIYVACARNQYTIFHPINKGRSPRLAQTIRLIVGESGEDANEEGLNMSVGTSADRYRDKALENIDDAIKNFSEIVINHTYGWDEYDPKYFDQLISALNNLLHIRTDLQ